MEVAMRRVLSFLAVVVLTVVAAAPLRAETPPTPDAFFGFTPGSDRNLFDYEQLLAYLDKLAAASPRLELREVGRSPLDRPMAVLFMSSPDNIARLDQLRELNRTLALDPEIPDARRDELIRDGKVFVMETLSMHSTEVAPTQSLPLFAYEIATTQDPAVLAQLDGVVLMVVPNHNPDGMDMVVEHYRKYRGTKYEGSSLPRVYHRYVGHDNNRDFVSLTQADTRVISRLFSTEWYPQVLVEKHQMGSTGPRYFVPVNHDPIAENIDEGLWNWMAVFGADLQRDMTADGHQGVASHWLFDNYWPGSTETSLWKGVISFLTEAASCKVATPVYVEPTELQVRGKGLAEYKKSVNMPDPWPGGWWHLGDIVAYELSSMRSVLATAAANRAAILRFRNDLCRKEVAKGRTEPPFAYVLPAHQRDRGALPALVALLEQHGVTVDRLTRDVVVDGRALSAGDVVVPLAQPYRAFVKEVMERQVYPVRHYTPGGEIIKPYDVTSWSLPLHWDLDCFSVDVRSADLESDLEPVTSATLRGPAPTLPDGPYWGLAYPSSDNASFAAAFAAFKAGISVVRTQSEVGTPAGTLPAGSFLLRADEKTAAHLGEVVHAVSVPPLVLTEAPDVATRAVRAPRIALVETWTHDMNAGWTRYVLDTYGVGYTVVHPADIASLDLAKTFDVVVFPGSGSDLLVKGERKRGDRYFPSDLPPEFRKGMGDKGLVNLGAFVEGGGVVVAWGQSVGLFTDGLKVKVDDSTTDTERLPVADATDAAKKAGLYVPGSLLEVRVADENPLTWGLPDRFGVFSRGEPVLRTSIPVLDADRRVVLVYPENHVLLSGYIEGESAIEDTPAMVWVRKGKGQLALAAFAPQFRASTPGAFPLLFNALLLPPPQLP